VWREIERNGSRKGHYKGRGAEAAARGRKREQYHCRRKIDGVLEQIVVEKLSYGWSPEQISGRLKLEGRGEVSTETIYRYLLFDKKMGGELFKCLRLGRRERRRRFPRRTRFFKISEERKDITKRSLEADRREEAGHWERDLMIGKQSGPAVLAMVDRRSRFTVLERVENRSPGHVGWVTVEALKKRELEVKSLTNDRGIEFYRPSIVERELNAPVYFARAYASWERGTVENTIGLVRQYLAKGQSLEAINPQLLDDIAETLNNRPRKTHGFQTPHEIHFSSQTKQVRSQSFYRRKIYKDQARSLLLAINFGAEPSDVALIP
jgi:IS30 family transposase